MPSTDASPYAVIAAVTAGYVIGSVPIALLVGRRQRVDLREVGDRNPGYWNAKDHLSRRASIGVFLGDSAKGVLAGAIGIALPGPWWIAYMAVAAAMIGHAWPLFAHFRGGRSILTFAGGVCVLSPVAAAIAIAALLVVTLLRSFAWGARVGVFGYPLAQLIVDPATHVAATGVLMSIIGVRFGQAALATRAPHGDRHDDRHRDRHGDHAG
ncbi:MAG: glycerol-3-phosphate acyltransferase [Acidimicrobiia bacterium]